MVANDWEMKAAETWAKKAVVDAEVAAAAAIERLLSERLAVKGIVHLTGFDPATVRRLRQLGTDSAARDGLAADIVPGRHGGRRHPL